MKNVVINGMEFKLENLVPNYRGEFDTNPCDECHLNLTWADYGTEHPCRLVECHAAKHIVWNIVGGLENIKAKPILYHVEFSWTCEILDEDTNEWYKERGKSGEEIKCHREEIEQKATEAVKEMFDDVEIRDLKVEVEDWYEMCE